jgi:beta-glucosidase
LIDKWTVRYDTRDVIKLDLVAGKEYKIKYEYFDNNGEAIAQLRWKVPGTKLEDYYKEEKEIASKSDYVIAVLGLNTAIEDEGQDKKDLNLPKSQVELIQELVKNTPKTIVVLEAGSPLAISWINDHVPAIVNAWYAGEQGGNAITDVLFGDYNPAGRLPITYYKSTDDLLPFDDYEIMKGRTYMYSDKTPLYPFGYGLSYTKFEYSGLNLSKPALNQADSLFVSVKIKNTGNSDGDEVVQLYVKNKASQQVQPIKSLRGFKRVSLKKSETKTVQIPLKSEDLRTFDEGKNKFVVDAGAYEIQVGASSEDIRGRTELIVK